MRLCFSSNMSNWLKIECMQPSKSFYFNHLDYNCDNLFLHFLCSFSTLKIKNIKLEKVFARSTCFNPNVSWPIIIHLATSSKIYSYSGFTCAVVLEELVLWFQNRYSHSLIPIYGLFFSVKKLSKNCRIWAFSKLLFYTGNFGSASA